MARGMVVIDEDRCKGCAVCIPVCPRHILELAKGRFNAKGYPPISVTDMEKCTGCTLCALVCPDVVFSVYRRKRAKKTEAVGAEG